jgi:hypothetical protein
LPLFDLSAAYEQPLKLGWYPAVSSKKNGNDLKEMPLHPLKEVSAYL